MTELVTIERLRTHTHTTPSTTYLNPSRALTTSARVCSNTCTCVLVGWKIWSNSNECFWPMKLPFAPSPTPPLPPPLLSVAPTSRSRLSWSFSRKKIAGAACSLFISTGWIGRTRQNTRMLPCSSMSRLCSFRRAWSSCAYSSATRAFSACACRTISAL